MLDALKKTKGNLLDIGCGWGTFTMKLAKARPDLKINGCDYNPKWLTLFNKLHKNHNVNLLLSDAHNLPYKKDQFDSVVMMDVLEHLSIPDKAITEIARVIKKGGTFHLVVPLEGELTTFDGWIKLLFNKNLKEKPIGHIQQFKKKDIDYLLGKNGFEISNTKYSYYLFYQTLSILYYLFLAFASKSKHIQVHGHDSKKPEIKILNFSVAVIGWITCLESFIFSRLKGQTLHITSIKKH